MRQREKDRDGIERERDGMRERERKIETVERERERFLGFEMDEKRTKDNRNNRCYFFVHLS